MLVNSQKAKVIEMTDEYRLFDAGGTEIGSIREVEQSKTKKAVRLFSGVDQFLTHNLGVFDSNGRPVLMLERPAKARRLSSYPRVLQRLNSAGSSAWPLRGEPAVQSRRKDGPWNSMSG